MAWLLTKYACSAALVVAISELAKRSDRLGGLLGALPLVTLLSLCWLYLEGQPQEKLANHAWYTFWYVLPTLPMFLAFPWLLRQFGFAGALAASCIISIFCFIVLDRILRAWLQISLW